MSVIVPQTIANILLTASSVLLVGLGFSLGYSAARFFNMAYAALFVAAPYLVVVLHSHVGVSFHVAIPVAVLAVGLLGASLDALIFGPLRRKNSSSLVLLLSSLGVCVVLLNVISLIFGDDSISVRLGTIAPGRNILGARITNTQLAIMAVSATVFAATAMFMRYARLGLAIRAVSSSPELAKIAGVHSDRVILWAQLISSSLVAVAGILVAVDVNMNPVMGMNALMMAVVIVCVGGIGSIAGVALGALLVGTAQHLGVWVIGSEWQDAIAFVMLLAFLVFKPEGILGNKVRTATV